MRTFHLCAAYVLAACLLACGSSSSAGGPDASADVTSDGANTCVSAGFTCDTIGPTSVCESAGPQYACANAGESCCKPGTYLSVDSGFCLALVDGGVGGVIPTPGTCAGQTCGAGCFCGLLQDGGMATSPASGSPVCNCSTGVTLGCFQNFDCGNIECTLGCTCTDPNSGRCDCPAPDGGVADAAND